MAKKFIYFVLLTLCIENSLIYAIGWRDVKTGVSDFAKCTWKALNNPLASAVIANIIVMYCKKDPEKEELEKKDMKSFIESRKLDNEAKRKKIELQSRSDWQDAEIKLTAAVAFEKTDQNLVQQRIEEKALELRERVLKLRKQKMEIVKQEMSYLGMLKEKMTQVQESLKDESLSESQKIWLLNELISLNRNYNKINSPISPQ